MNTIDLSIILPVYNGESFLDRAINSVLKQSLSSWELLLVNDGSTDSTADICHKYCLSDNRIHYIEQANHGLSSARNVGYSFAQGRYIVYLDADDYVDPDYYKMLICQAEQFNADFIVTGYIREFYYQNKERHVSIIKWPEKLLKSLSDIQCACAQPLFYNVYIHVWNKIYRRDFLEKYQIRFNELLKYGEDVPYNIQNLAHAHQILFSDLRGYHYICHNAPRLTTAWRDSLPAVNCSIYRQIYEHESRHWKINSSVVASGMYLRSCFLSLEKAINCNLSYREIRNIIFNILNFQETQLALSAVSKQYCNKEFLIYWGILRTRCPLFVYVTAQIRKNLKKLIGR